MTIRKGTISVNTQDILPIIKKWLYSEHDIFLRELVSNANDAITKRFSLARSRNEELPEPQITVALNKEDKSITISDNGLGMTEEEVEKYIAQLAFSGASDFVDKMKDAGAESKDDIIGKFGLGFYSAFMVSEKVEIETLSMDKGAKAIKWISEGSTEFSFDDSSKSEVGTSIKLYINEDSIEFLELYKLRTVLSSYCQFMPHAIELKDINAKIEEPKEGEEKKEATKDIINDAEPLWRKDPSTLKDEDYIQFYRKLFPMDPEPLFWLHLNVDHPFTLQGILYFPKLNPNKPLNESNIKLFCKQVFVSDNVKNIIPEFLVMLKGTIDSTDIPLNVSRSALQGDPNIKRISNYIVKKVAESLKKLYRSDREKYESVWQDIGVFVKYGVTSDKKFDELMRERVLFKNSEAKYVTLEEYTKSIPKEFEEKLKNKIIYFEEHGSDQALRKQLLTEKVQTVETDSYIDPHFMQYIEMNKVGEKDALSFVSVDTAIGDILSDDSATENGDAIKKLFMDTFGIKEPKADSKDEENKEAAPTFDPTDSNNTLDIEIKNMKGSTSPAYFKIDEQMKRFQQMTKTMGDTPFSMPIKKTLVVNPASPLVQNAYKIWEKGDNKSLAEKICHHVQDLASISSAGLDSKEKDLFVIRSQELISELSKFAL